MGQKVNPISNRLGIIRGWDSNWYGGRDYSDKLVEDAKIRKYLKMRLSKASVARIVIERTLKMITVTIHTGRPGMVIGRQGEEVQRLGEELKALTSKDVQVNVYEVRHPETNAVLVADNVARQLEGRVSFRRALKMAVSSAMRAGAEGIKIQVAGRLGGAEMSRVETVKDGRIPLHTFRADIDYALCEALTKVGLIGVKVWVCHGEVYGRRDLSPNVGMGTPSAQRGGQPRENRPRRRENARGERRERGDRRERR